MNIQFLNQNRYRKYPFRDDVSLIGKLNGVNYQLPDSFLLDATITTDKRFVYLKTIHSLSSSIIVELWSDVLIGACTVPKIGYTSPYTATIAGTPGRLVFGDISFIDFIGDITFDDTRTFFLDYVLKQDLTNRVKSVSFNNSGFLSGVLKLFSGYNIRIDVDKSRNAIIFNAIVGEGKGIFCGEPCPEPIFCQDIVRSINGITGDDRYSFSITAENHATVTDYPATNRVVIGTQIPLSRLNCTRPGLPGDDGPSGPMGPTGVGGGPPCEEGEGYCLECENCDEVENFCGICNICEVCNTCENCDISQNTIPK